MGITTNEADDHEVTRFLLTNSDSSDVDNSREISKRTGTQWSATAYIITGVIGAGVLSLAWSTAQLGWIAGPLSMIVFALITLASTLLLCDCYRTPDAEFGPIRNRSLTEAVKFYLGEKRQRICAIFVLESIYGCGIAYTITATESVSAIKKSNCYHREGHHADCGHDNSTFMLMFGAVQIIISQIPDFHNMAWLSIIAAVMSFSYASIGLALAIAKVIENGKFLGSITGVPADNLTEKLWLVFQALGDIAFAYPYSVIVLEIQDTLKSPPTENQTMKKASTAAILTTTFFYLSCGCFGYAAFGNDTPGNLLTGFGFYEPYWLVDFANACIVLHLVGGYRVINFPEMSMAFNGHTIIARLTVYSQPAFALVEKWFNAKFPDSRCAQNFNLKLPLLPDLQLNPFRLWFRTVYVATITGISMLFPYFNQVLGLFGALNFWSLGIYFPVEIYIVQKNIGSWTRKWIILQVFSFICMVISVVSLIGSVQGLISAKLS